MEKHFPGEIRQENGRQLQQGTLFPCVGAFQQTSFVLMSSFSRRDLPISQLMVGKMLPLLSPERLQTHLKLFMEFCFCQKGHKTDNFVESLDLESFLIDIIIYSSYN